MHFFPRNENVHTYISGTTVDRAQRNVRTVLSPSWLPCSWAVSNQELVLPLQLGSMYPCVASFIR